MSKKKDILEKYVKTNPRKEGGFNKLVDGDFTPTTKYADYMCKIWSSKETHESYTVKQLINTVKEFDSLLPHIENKDIYSSDYNTFSKLKDKVLIAHEIKTEKEFVREDHIKILVDNDEYLLGRLLTKEGAMRYGKGTKWCISAKNNIQFTSYSSWNYIYVFIRKKLLNKPCDKFAILIEKTNTITSNTSWWNASDNNVPTNNIMNSSWDLTTVLDVTHAIRTDAVVEQRIDEAKYKVRDFKNLLEKVTRVDIGYDLSILKNVGDDRYMEINETVKKIVETLKEKNNI